MVPIILQFGNLLGLNNVEEQFAHKVGGGRVGLLQT